MLLVVFAVVAAALAVLAQIGVKSAFRTYAKVPAKSGHSGAEVAQFMLKAAGVSGVKIERSRGFLKDHYDVRKRVLRLSPAVHDGRHIAAYGVAAHEAGHALQHAKAYPLLELRNLAVPSAALGSAIGIPLVVVGLLLGLLPVAYVGLAFFAAVVLLQVLNFPVEIDASRRAAQVLRGSGLIRDPEEDRGVKTILTTAALTYVATALAGILWFAYFFSVITGRGRSVT